jgi:hypothetical protein
MYRYAGWQSGRAAITFRSMQRGGYITVAVRVAFAAAFTFMSLFHGPAMATAKPAQPVAHHLDRASASHHHSFDNAVHDQHLPDARLSCYGIGCCIIFQGSAAALPVKNEITVMKLAPRSAAAMVSAILEPVVPPPRRQM